MIVQEIEFVATAVTALAIALFMLGRALSAVDAEMLALWKSIEVLEGKQDSPTVVSGSPERSGGATPEALGPPPSVPDTSAGVPPP